MPALKMLLPIPLSGSVTMEERSRPNHIRADAFQLCLNGANRPRHAGRIQIKAGKQFADL